MYETHGYFSSKSTRFRKPQFFEAFRQERENLGSLDLAAGHLAKKGVHTSIKLASEKEIDDDLTPWGGVSSRSVLSTELLPMMIKIQALSSREACHWVTTHQRGLSTLQVPFYLLHSSQWQCHHTRQYIMKASSFVVMT